MCHLSAVVSETRDGATQQTLTQQTWEPAEQSWCLERLRSNKLSLVSYHGGTEAHTPSAWPQHGHCSTQTSPFFQTCRFQWSASLKRFHVMKPLHPTCLDLFFGFRILSVHSEKKHLWLRMKPGSFSSLFPVDRKCSICLQIMVQFYPSMIFRGYWSTVNFRPMLGTLVL